MTTEAESPAAQAKFFWFLPTSGDSRSIVGSSHASSQHIVPEGFRPPTRRYLGEIARRQTDWVSRACLLRPAPGVRTPG